jgi:hypothetical protein
LRSWTHPSRKRRIPEGGVGLVGGYQHGRTIVTARNAPYRMQRPALCIQLQHERRGAFRIIGVFLNHDGPRYAGKNLIDPESIVSQGVIAVLRYSHVACCDQVSKFLPKGGHVFPDASEHRLA